MERLTLLAPLVLAGCAAVPAQQPIFVEAPRTIIQRPVLPIENIPEEASAVDVFKLYMESLYVCVGYAKELEKTCN